MKHLKKFEQYNDDKSKLDISYKKLNIFPQEYLPLPNSLLYLYCYNNNLISLPELPNSLIELYCSYNNLTSLPNLSKSLQEIWCSNNNLTSLPELPNSLQYLLCHSNNLTSLPELPKSLIQCYFSGNAYKNPVQFDIFNNSFKGYYDKNKNRIYTFYTPEQQEKFKSYEYQKKFMENTPFEWKDLGVEELGIHPDIRKEFDFIFEYDSYKL